MGLAANLVTGSQLPEVFKPVNTTASVELLLQKQPTHNVVWARNLHV